MIDAPMLVRKLLVRRNSSIRPLRVQVNDEADWTGAAAWPADCIVVLWGIPLLYGDGPLCSAAVIAGLLRASCRLHSLLHCI